MNAPFLSGRIAGFLEDTYQDLEKSLPSLDDAHHAHETELSAFEKSCAVLLDALIIGYVYTVRLPALAGLMFATATCLKIENAELEGEKKRNIPEDQRHTPSNAGTYLFDDE